MFGLISTEADFERIDHNVKAVKNLCCSNRLPLNESKYIMSHILKSDLILLYYEMNHSSLQRPKHYIDLSITIEPKFKFI